MPEVWCARGFLQEAEGSNLHMSDAHENSVMAVGEQPYSMTVQSYASFLSTDKWDSVALIVRSFHPKGKTLLHGGHLNCTVLQLHQILHLIHHVRKMNYPTVMIFFFLQVY